MMGYWGGGSGICVCFMHLCWFLGIDVLPLDYGNNVNEDDCKVKEEEMAMEKHNNNDDAVTAQPVASQRSKQLSKSKNSKKRRCVVLMSAVDACIFLFCHCCCICPFLAFYSQMERWER